ncbi:formylglycine-generating enzyme family protein [Cohnella endophytica]|uniref:Formylglycine-generating enzyme family protein n=1 Tax=Cohnella endophytica TaxID=2419778 RepID=A0A494XCQ0_9BACL|nr:SUMF1/EgtB/PvdO family nonheme iron enzyme [Cohnella endophytica]RKP46286.1 formylglycine-generating enzyme family protein [Cohnella endophytica]
MRKLLIFLCIATMLVAAACSQDKSDKNVTSSVRNDNFVFVKGGVFTNKKSNYYGQRVALNSFYIGKYEITQKEWTEVMGNNPSQFKGDNLPVEKVSWYDAVEYCNKRSIKEGLKPYYNINKNTIDPTNKSEFDNLKWTVTFNEGANGYRLPTEAEWQYAADGGQLSKSYTYSGSDNADDVAWYWKNAGDKMLSGDWNWPLVENNHNQTKPIGNKKPNELGLYDMSGNVREWCWNGYGDTESNSTSTRVVKGGSWMGDVGDLTYLNHFEANGVGADQGLRLVRDN